MYRSFMTNRFKISFLVSMYLAGFIVLTSTESTSELSLEEIDDTHMPSRLKQRPLIKLGKEAELASKLRQALLTDSEENGSIINQQIQEIYDKAISPTPTQIKQIFILNKALYKEKIKFMRERNAHKRKAPHRQALKPNMFKRPPVSSKKVKSLGVRETHGIIHKTKQAPRVTRKFVYHKEHWRTQREKGLKLGRWASSAYGK